MNYGEVVQKLINGYSLYTYMVPDDSLPRNRPLHAEGFYLPHILITGDVFWGMSRSVHLLHWKNWFGILSFCYSNHPGGLFFSYNTELRDIVFMSLKRYKRHKFVLKDKWELIWDFESKEKYPVSRIDYLIE